MEYLIGLGILGAGYAISQQEVPKTQDPHGKNIYENRDYQKVMGSVLKRSTNNYKKFADGDGNIVIPGPPMPLLNKVDYQDTENLPVEYHDKPLPDNQNIKTPSDGFYGVSLTGTPIDPMTFKHNNMVPFFGAKITQNTDENANRAVMENFTGQQDNYRLKQEVGRFFPVQTNVSNPYGAQNMVQFEREHMVPSNRRANEAPIQQIHVGPGLNKGYTAEPSGGFQQAETRDYVMPKTVDEMRTKNNPKVSFKGRIIRGNHISRRGIEGFVAKNQPDAYYINSPNRYFTTVGAVTGPRQRPSQVIKATKRKITGLNQMFRINPASNQEPSYHAPRKEKFRASRRNIYKAQLYRNLEAVSKWFGGSYDYSKKSYSAKEQNRQATEPNHRRGDVAPINPNGYINDSNDITRTTIKQTTLHSNDGAGPSMGNANYIKDSNDIAKTTIKETTIDNDWLGAAKGKTKHTTGILDAIKTTIRELLIGDSSPNYGGAIGKEGMRGGYSVHKHKAKKTHRQTTSKENFGGAGTSVPAQVDESGARAMRLNTNKERIARGRSPTKVGAKKIIGKEAINMNTKKSGDVKNRELQKRGVMSTKTYNSLPQTSASVRTHEPQKTTYKSQANRNVDPFLVQAFKNNPYTKPLDSWVFH